MNELSIKIEIKSFEYIEFIQSKVTIYSRHSTNEKFILFGMRCTKYLPFAAISYYFNKIEMENYFFNYYNYYF
jgi:hypothetical protein